MIRMVSDARNSGGSRQTLVFSDKQMLNPLGYPTALIVDQRNEDGEATPKTKLRLQMQIANANVAKAKLVGTRFGKANFANP